MKMLTTALSQSQKSVSEASYKKYLDMKKVFERESGRPMGVAAQPVSNASAPSAAQNNAALDLGLGGDDDDSDDLEDWPTGPISRHLCRCAMASRAQLRCGVWVARETA